MSQPISAARQHELDTGLVASTHLAECLVVDFATLLQTVAALPDAAVHRMRDAASKGITQRMALAATLLREAEQGDVTHWQSHPSDTVRGWICYLIGSDASLGLAEKLQSIQPLADDQHFGVREWAWLAVRADLVAAPLQALTLLLPWVDEASPYLRRFACEALRPRGVWAAHIALFKQQPQHVLPLLEALANDPERYVQDSVGNWLNDASKTQPEWVRDLCARWQREHNSAANAYIRKRAQRSLR
ncbi:DNA alkylation repair protein [uncultured Stenotrophomonas sp.]|uniref:DNA alkylation repair protein n=1 Tax=uncultured Stenotrophomonas sp. TaxID=165438 RepID=UPI0025D25D3A|nr:DNA alkylation repair protein [uncultured Stenotrophomonas sp.]